MRLVSFRLERVFADDIQGTEVSLFHGLEHR